MSGGGVRAGSVTGEWGEGADTDTTQLNILVASGPI